MKCARTLYQSKGYPSLRQMMNTLFFRNDNLTCLEDTRYFKALFPKLAPVSPPRTACIVFLYSNKPDSNHQLISKPFIRLNECGGERKRCKVQSGVTKGAGFGKRIKQNEPDIILPSITRIISYLKSSGIKSTLLLL